ncbi:hypothetical protein BKA80DRAFT_271570 [Phyllosticta citrichinensis]
MYFSTLRPCLRSFSSPLSALASRVTHIPTYPHAYLSISALLLFRRVAVNIHLRSGSSVHPHTYIHTFQTYEGRSIIIAHGASIPFFLFLRRLGACCRSAGLAGWLSCRVLFPPFFAFWRGVAFDVMTDAWSSWCGGCLCTLLADFLLFAGVSSCSCSSFMVLL